MGKAPDLLQEGDKISQKERVRQLLGDRAAEHIDIGGQQST